MGSFPRCHPAYSQPSVPYMAMGQNPVPPVNMPIPTKIDQNGWCTNPKMAPLVLTHSQITGRKYCSRPAAELVWAFPTKGLGGPAVISCSKRPKLTSPESFQTPGLFCPAYCNGKATRFQKSVGRRSHHVHFVSLLRETVSERMPSGWRQCGTCHT